MESLANTSGEPEVEKEVSLREHLQRISRSRSKRKILTCRLNLAKAMLSRFPGSPRWEDEFARLQIELKELGK